MIDEALRRVREGGGDVRAVLLAGRDGIVVTAVPPSDADASELIAATFAELFRRVREAHRDAGLAIPEEITTGGATGRVIVRAVGDEYLLLALLGEGAIAGKARHDLALAASAIVPELP